jgi:hypothetical protein
MQLPLPLSGFQNGTARQVVIRNTATEGDEGGERSFSQQNAITIEDEEEDDGRSQTFS